VLQSVLSSLLIGLGLGAIIASALAALILRSRLAQLHAAERRARAAERMAEVGAMTGGLAHEIKNPLSTISLNAQLLAEGIDELAVDEEARGRLSRRVGSLRREVERLRGILTDFLQFAGQLRLETAPTDLNQIVDELADFFLPQAEQQGIRLRTDLEVGPLFAMLDAPHIKQAVLNLMLNAVQAMTERPVPAGAGTRAVAAAAGLPRELILKTERGQGTDRKPSVVLHVIDTGPGMNAATLERIYQPYFTTKSGGTGLGLPTARRIIESHQGRIDVHSEPGRGTDFTISIPAMTD
jgi:signal transduction histidine kinase